MCIAVLEKSNVPICSIAAIMAGRPFCHLSETCELTKLKAVGSHTIS